MSTSFVFPERPAPTTVCAAVTTRQGGVSTGGYASFNLAAHVGDDPSAVAQNRARLREALALPTEPRWLNQVHGIHVVDAATVSTPPDADASVTTTPGVICAVLTADCLPVLFCDRAGTSVAAAHAGWRGLVGGVLEATVAAMPIEPRQMLAWLGPAIGPAAFEVGDEVRAAFVADDAGAAVAFHPTPAGRWLADLYVLARRRLARVGVTAVYGGGLCTYSDVARFYSFRREPVTGRLASLIWLR